MEKTQLYGDRGVRRHRSFSKWMRRLKRDWNDHGWGRDIDGRYNCDCFYLDHPQAIRFKDTPKGCSSGPGCGNPRRWYNGKKRSNDGELTLAERVADMADREFWSKRKRRSGLRQARIQCARCGFLLGFAAVEFHSWVTGKYGHRCEGCKKKGL